jgi:Protein of unknown function (DUF3313)
MSPHALLRVAVFLGAAAALGAQAAPAVPEVYEGLVKVGSKNLDTVYLLPGADFRAYTKVMIDAPEVKFKKGWVKDINRSRSVSSRISENDAQQIAKAMRSGFEGIFAAAFKGKGYEVVSAPAADVLRLSPAIVNLYLNAPNPSGPGVRQSFTVEAGEATFVLQASDSTTGALLGIAIDRRETRNRRYGMMATTGTNSADFEDLFKRWADICVKGLDALKSGQQARSAAPATK